MKRGRKANDDYVTEEFINYRRRKAEEKGYPTPKYLQFCETMIARGFYVRLYEARKTVSKYVTVLHEGKSFKVRFSNHKPIYYREVAGDCDFFVGISHAKTTTTDQAIAATLNFFGVEV